MNIEQIKQLWKPNYSNPKSAVEWWNGKAGSFVQRELPNAQTNLAIRIIERENMVTPGCTTLDVGCGAGRMSFALENMGAIASATDFSPEMIRAAIQVGKERNSDVKFSVDDWHIANLKDKGWEKAFDLVLAHMTPAIASADTFLKLMEASCGWVLMVKPTRRKNEIYDELNKIVGARIDAQVLDEALAYAFDIAWLMGGKPKLEYESQLWEIEQPLEDAVKEYTARISATTELKPGAEEEIRTYLASIAKDGVVHEKTHTEIAAMYWQTT